MSIFDQFPLIELGNIILREIYSDDSSLYYRYISDPQVNRFISDEDIPKNEEAAKQELQYWADLYRIKRSFYWAIANKKDNKIIGSCGFNMWSKTHARVEISYDLARNYWRKGIMSMALRSICDFAFVNMKVNRIQATVACDNIASINLLKRLNFTQEALMRQYGILHGITKDFYLYSLVKSDLIF